MNLKIRSKIISPRQQNQGLNVEKRRKESILSFRLLSKQNQNSFLSKRKVGKKENRDFSLLSEDAQRVAKRQPKLLRQYEVEDIN